MSSIANKRRFLEAANALVKKSVPDLRDMSAVCEALSDVMTDCIGAQCRIVIKVDAAALQKAIEAAEKQEGL